jgi:hypothetical protein
LLKVTETYAAHQRIQCSGTIAAGGGVSGEIFSFSLASLGSLTDAELCAAVLSPIESWFHTADVVGAANIGDFFNLTQVRVESVNPDGTIASSYALAASAVGGSSSGDTGNAPAICCWAITLETADLNPKGARIRGRFYPPNTGWYPFGSSALSAGTGFGTNIAQSGANLVSLLNAAGAVIIVASQTGGGHNSTVTGCSADNVVDTIRRRKNSAVGTRGTQAIPYTP